MISLKQLEDMFTNMRLHTNWNIDDVLLWGYFFTDLDRKPLERAAEHLMQSGYYFVSIYKTDDGRAYVLHVERSELHTPQTLHIRNSEFEQLASKIGLESYDGMDVGPSPELA